MDQQGAQIRIAALADPTESTVETTGRLARRESEVAGEVAAGREAPDVSHEGDEGGGREQAHAGDRAQARHLGTLAREALELLLDRANAGLELCDLVRGFGEEDPQRIRQVRVGLGDQHVDVRHDLARTHRDRKAELTQ